MKKLLLLVLGLIVFASWYVQYETKLDVTFKDNLLFLNVKNDSGEDLKFLINSQEGNYLNKTGLKKLGFKSKNENIWLDSGLEDLFKKQNLPIPSNGNFGQTKKKDTVIDGVLGFDWLQEKIWVIDYLREEYYYQEIRKASRDKRIGSMELKDNYTTVSVEIDTFKIPMCIDIGANIMLDPHVKAILNTQSNYLGISFLDDQVFQDLKAKNKKWKIIRNKKGNIQIMEVPKVVMGSISVGPMLFAKYPETYLQSSCNQDTYGSLGGNFWSQFGSITFDFNNNGIYHNRNE